MNRLKSNLRIAVNAQIQFGGGAGGVETVLRALAALGSLEDGDEEYVFIGHWADADWLKPFANERLTVIQAPPPIGESRRILSENLRNSLGRLRPLARKIKHAFDASPPTALPNKAQIEMPVSNGFYESLGCDVVHFPYQEYAVCKVPTVYNPHDLQHLHYPQFFSPDEIAKRETIYPAACRAAHTVVVASEFVKQDVARNYRIEADKIQVIHWSPPETNLKKIADEDARLLLEKYEIPPDEPFALYPAMTWEHKNHIRLLEAVALLRCRDGLKINLICTGHKNAFYPQIERRLHELKLENSVKFTGVVSHKELSGLYLTAQFVVVPTLFEAASAPLFEAWQHRVAVACSSVTSLPEQAANAALLFDPFSVEAIADALKRMTIDEHLRRTLRADGTKRLSDFSFERTARAFRAVYRRAAGRNLNDEDRNLLSGTPTGERETAV